MRNLLAGLILTLLTSSGFAQNVTTLYDGRLENNPEPVSSSDVQLVRRNALPAARRAWGSECEEATDFIGTASGSFTATGKAQRIVLYRYCEMGHAFSNNGLVVIEGGRVVRNIVYNGGGENTIVSLPDINQNGISEVLLAGGSTNQGYTGSVISILELTSSGALEFGDADVYEDNCGAVERCKMTAYKVTAKPGAKPIYYRETFQKRGGKWQSAGAAKVLKLRESYRSPKSEFRILK